MSRVVIVSNRGPMGFAWHKDAWRPVPSSSALTIMLEPLVRDTTAAWFCCVPEPLAARRPAGSRSPAIGHWRHGSLDVVPIPIPETMYEEYYGRVANGLLWPLQHRTPAEPGPRSDRERARAWSHGYAAANRRVAAVVAASADASDRFLIHDYHLYLLPALVRRHLPRARILHFTHIPFLRPLSLQYLPAGWRASILSGLLGSDVLGFQLASDVEAFLECCESDRGIPVDRRAMTVGSPDGRRVRLRAFPASVNPDELRRTMRSGTVAEVRRRLSGYFTDRTIVRVDRIDPSKNQVAGFLAFSQLLARRPDLRGRVRFLAFLVPSRGHLAAYQQYAAVLSQTVERVNDAFRAECAGAPIELFYGDDRERALAAMERCDVLLVNPVADGMNLVAKEWAIVSQRPGVLVISSGAGAALEAAGDALVVSATDIGETAEALGRALDMADDERAARLARFRRRVESWTARHWLRAQLEELDALLPGGTEARPAPEF